MIYLDHNATTPIDPEVLNAMLPWLETHFGNPSSNHALGRRAATAVEQARTQVAALIGAEPEGIVFTSGGTESSNLALHGITRTGDHIITTAAEHPATRHVCEWLAGQGCALTTLSVEPDGRLDPSRLEEAIHDRTRVVSVMLANNETGAINPISAIVRICHPVILHVDAAQAAGKVPVDVQGVDLMSLAGHKLYAPKGIGALYVRPGLTLAPLMRGGGQERGLRPGTENVPYIVGLGVACTVALKRLAQDAARLARLRDRLHHHLVAGVPSLSLSGATDARLPNTLNVRFPGVLGADVLAGAPEIAASTGSACHEGEHLPSSVLTAMGIEPDDALGAVRLTLGRSTTQAQVDRAGELLVASYQQLARRA